MNRVIIGLGAGDEGKGLVTDWLCSRYHPGCVIRFSGGQNAGHTVCLDGVRHVFSNFGSGTLRGFPTYWSKHCTVDPVGLLVERAVLQEKGFFPKIMIDPRCPVTTPYDISYNIGRARRTLHGSCGVGINATKEREKNHYSLLFEDLYNSTVFKIKMEMIHNYYFYLVNNMTSFDSNPDLTDFNMAIYLIRRIEEDIKCERDRYTSVSIYEGSQGLLLDQDIGFFPHVTRAYTGVRTIDASFGGEDIVYYVTRAYQTRHGNGPMTNEDISHNILLDENETNVTHEYQGELRRSLLDLDLLLYALNKDTISYLKSYLVITCLDHINDYRFTHKGEIINCLDEKEFVSKIKEILNFEKVYLSRTPYGENIEEF